MFTLFKVKKGDLTILHALYLIVNIYWIWHRINSAFRNNDIYLHYKNQTILF